MARQKIDLVPVVHDTKKNPNAVKKGCCSCLYMYAVKEGQLPCSGCKCKEGLWLYWTEDTRPRAEREAERRASGLR